MKKIQVIYLGLLILSFNGCKELSGLTVCISDPKRSGFSCSKNGDKAFLLDYKDSDNYNAFPPDDFRTLAEKCGVNRDGEEEASNALIQIKGN